MEGKTKRNTYSKEFKTEAVELASRIGTVKAGEELGVHQTTIRNWRKKLNAPVSTNSNQKAKTYEELEKELKKAQKELEYLREINKVLKKSTAIFSSDQMGSFK